MLVYIMTTAYLCVCGFFMGMSGEFQNNSDSNKTSLAVAYLFLAFIAGGYGLAWVWSYLPLVYLFPALILAWLTGRVGRKVSKRYSPAWLCILAYAFIPTAYHLANYRGYI